MKRRRAEQFEQPSLVPMADMVTNTVGIMLFILIFVSLSAGGVVVSRHLPREKHTDARVVWMLCSGGRLVQFDPATLGRQLAQPLGRPSYDNAAEWAHRYSARTLETDTLEATGKAEVEFSRESGPNVLIRQYVLVRTRRDRGDDDLAVRTPGSAFRRLLTDKSSTGNFFFFFVSPDSIALFRAARDQATQAGFGVGWSPLGPDEPALISLSGGGREATIQ